jgi:hypothetical protein
MFVGRLICQSYRANPSHRRGNLQIYRTASLNACASNRILPDDFEIKPDRARGRNAAFYQSGLLQQADRVL